MNRPGGVDHHHQDGVEGGGVNVNITGTEWSHYQAYLTWINCQLKKHPQAIRPIQDIRQELQDGTIVANLIEILGNQRLAGMDWQAAPQALPIRMANYNCILRFLVLQHVNLHPTINVPDLAQGNLKTQMRLVHAIAGHFKPESITTARAPDNGACVISRANKSGGPPPVLSSSCSISSSLSAENTTKTPSKTGSLVLPSPLRKSKSYSSLRFPANNSVSRNGTESDVRRVTFDRTTIYSGDMEGDPEEDAESKQKNWNSEDSVEVREMKEKLEVLLKRTTAALTSPSRTEEETKNILDSQQKVFRGLIESLSASNQALHADISCYKDRCSILETAKTGLLSKIHQVEQELYRVRDDLQKMQIMNLNCSSSTSSNGSSCSPSLEQAEFQKKIDFKNRQLAELRRELDLKQDYIAQLHNKGHSSFYDPQIQGFRGDDDNVFLPAHARPLPTEYSHANGMNTTTLLTTKVLYYLDGDITPIRCTIPKHFREITLHDIKKVIDRPAVYRYYFETIDPDVGRVKEEISKDNALIPDAEGKIIVTLELTSLDTHV